MRCTATRCATCTCGAPLRYASGVRSGEYDGRSNTAIRAASWHNRVQKVMRVGAAMASLRTVKRSRPVFPIAET